MSNNQNVEITPEVVDLVVARLETLPPNISMSVGDKGNFDLRELIEHVKDRDEVGKQIIEMQLLYLQSLKELVPAE
ncbi:MAG: hypothetical protein ABSE18_00935 [Minisyncoccia bacterium]|jgi:hypothetical protein